jgi:hypothetical protein
MDVMFPARSINRVPSQHMMPPLAPLLLQKPFSDFIPPSIFKDFIATRHFVTIPALNIHWKEKARQFEAGARRSQTVMCVEEEDDSITDEDKRMVTCGMLESIYESWEKALCRDDCCDKKCKKCKAISQQLKKKFKEGIRQRVAKRILHLLLQRKKPFEKVPPINSTLGMYEDEDCRITKVFVED